MPSLLRRSLTCFYCGTKSNLRFDGKIRKFRCQSCEAVNYLDEKGQITDPPTNGTPQNTHYAIQVPRPRSPELDAQDTSLFCSTCLKNQYLVTQALASYLPSTDDPQYAEFEASHPEYKAQLEERYPQVCAKCEPRVRRRIQTAQYAARSDHLRRVMERNRGSSGTYTTPTTSGGSWKGGLVNLCGLIWWSSALVQIVWHLSTFLVDWEGSAPTVDVRPEAGTCLQNAITTAALDYGCFDSVHRGAIHALMLGILVIWWSPALNVKLRTSRAHLMRVGQHIFMQAVVLAIRSVAWWTLAYPTVLGLTLPAFRGAHAFMVLFIIIGMYLGYTVMYLQKPPPIKFSTNIEPLLPERSQDKPEVASELNHLESLYLNKSPMRFGSSETGQSAFPIENLGSPITPSLDRQSARTPSIYANTEAGASDDDTETTAEYDPDNNMDWTPTQPDQLSLRHPAFSPPRSFQKSTSFSPPNAAYNQALGVSSPNQSFTTVGASQSNPLLGSNPYEPSPFRGPLPAAPIHPNHKARNPLLRQQFRKTGEQTQEQFLGQLMSNLGSSKQVSPQGGKKRAEMVLQKPQWVMEEKPKDTGLESLFDRVFTIGDHPAHAGGEQAVVGAEKGRASGLGGGQQRSVMDSMTGIVVFGLLAAVLGSAGWVWSVFGSGAGSSSIAVEQ
ncbi:hypothetical protein P152DRAFT_475970 [Eremomyces bilateralis CBS 781.70]|uniref:Ima1 N-terminal domain-containing protein n=1 Tax=Eremomyces bilateralis CBS 781.70 TaxID=1392243 RepID=A0A6G1FWQ5_9PEZI|nr:uncharacterized protein P152DRAFT_475970 [Eremomyces bilateralis CBS 781.70]KAF1810132.1 hypothetical protein P152DRAFT_475970 [Eremomyces bilateralis CBS 781.70]